MKKSYCFLLANLFALSLFATHNRAGEIQYRQIGERTIQASIITYTEPSSTPSDRDSLEIFWGDGTSQWVMRSNGMGTPPQGVIFNPRNKQNIYTAEHTFTDFGEYTLALDDRNRSEGIMNIGFGNSDQFSFYIFNTFTLSAETNSSPQTLLPPIDIGFTFTQFEHLATAFDVDGDSLSYQLITPQMTDGVDVTNYRELTEFGNNTILTLDSETGRLIWDSPEIAGTYSLAIEITSYRDGIQNGRFIRDMIINVDNDPSSSPIIVQDDLPAFGSIQEVEIGETIQLTIPTNGDNLFLLEAGGGLLSQDIQPATFNALMINQSINGTFSWTVDASHVREQAYDMAFKISNNQDLADFYLIRYKVNGLNTSAPVLAEDDHDIILYPNPTSDFLVLKSDAHNFSDYEIFSVAGELMKHGKLTSDRLDIQSLSSGSYILLLDNRYSLQFSKAEK